MEPRRAERRSRLRASPTRARVGIALLCLSALVLSAGIVELAVARHPKALEKPAIDAHHLAVVRYPTDKGAGVATIDSEGLATPCFEGSSDLMLLDLSYGTIIYTDRHQISSIPLTSCSEPPKLLATYKDLTGHSAPMGAFFRCAARSPDGARVAISIHSGFEPEGVWVEKMDGSARRFLGGYAACDWVDNDHLRFSGFEDGPGIDPFAIDASTGSRSFFENPDSWQGSRSVDGTKVVYATDRNPRPVTYVLDRETNQTTQIRRGGGAIDSPPGSNSVWNSSASRFILTDQPTDASTTAPVTYVYSIRGGKPVRIPLPMDSQEVGWFSDQTLWVVGDGALNLIDLKTRRWQGVFLPGVVSDSDPGGIGILVTHQRQGSVRQPRFVAPADIQRHSIKEFGIAMKLLPSWELSGCHKCDIEGYPVRRIATSVTAPGGPQPYFASTTDSVNMAIHKVLRHSGALEACNPNTQACISYTRKTVKLGAISFTELDIEFFEDGETIFVGQVEGKTLLISALPFDPSESVILDSLQLAG